MSESEELSSDVLLTPAKRKRRRTRTKKTYTYDGDDSSLEFSSDAEKNSFTTHRIYAETKKP